MHLQGIQSDAPIFRLSDSLVNEKENFCSVMNRLIGEEKFLEIKELLF